MKKEKKNGPLSKNDYYNNNDDNNFFKCFVLLRLGVQMMMIIIYNDIGFLYENMNQNLL